MSRDLESRVQKLEDIIAIENLKHTYLNACDAKDVELMKSTLKADHCDIDYGPVGKFNHRDDLLKLFTQAACHDFMLESHHAHNPIINIIDEANASGEWALTYSLINTKDNSIVTLQGRYIDEYLKIDDQWVISKTQFVGKSSLNLQVEDELLKVIFAGSPS